MELIRGLHNLRPRHHGSVVAQGAFDGVHRGHQMVMKRLVEKGRELGLPTTVACYEPLPREYFSPTDAPARLMSFREKFLAVRELGIDRMLRIPFTPRLIGIEAADYVRMVFRDGLGAKYVVLGDDQRFGKGRRGDIEMMRTLGQEYGFEVEAMKSLRLDDERISSTRIREVLARGDFELAAELLGRPFTLSGRVMTGKRLGRTLGAPTANVHLNRLRSPLSGVFAVEITGASDRKEVGVANVGTRPTIGDLLKAILEVHILDFKGDIYRRNITVKFCEKLREERKFESLDQLREQIHRDIGSARHYFGLAD